MGVVLRAKERKEGRKKGNERGIKRAKMWTVSSSTLSASSAATVTAATPVASREGGRVALWRRRASTRRGSQGASVQLLQRQQHSQRGRTFAREVFSTRAAAADNNNTQAERSVAPVRSRSRTPPKRRNEKRWNNFNVGRKRGEVATFAVTESTSSSSSTSAVGQSTASTTTTTAKSFQEPPTTPKSSPAATRTAAPEDGFLNEELWIDEARTNLETLLDTRTNARDDANTVAAVMDDVGRAAAKIRQEVKKDIPTSYEDLLNNGEFNRDLLLSFFSRRPAEVLVRVSAIVAAGVRIYRAWQAEESLPIEKRTRAVMLRDELAALGPVFVKIGQTLSQRADLIGDEAADALKSLQESNRPFDDQLAFKTIAEDLKWEGRLAPEPHPFAGLDGDGGSSKGRPMFKELDSTCVASASLGQVYRATTWEGKKLAIKVQRPGVIREVALDWTCWALALEALRRVWNVDTDLAVIADEVAVGVWKELDYRLEAANMDEFNRRHAHLKFCYAPQWVSEFTGPPGGAKVLATEWVEGAHLKDLNEEQQQRMVRLAVDACVAQLVGTGYVHADPHEGNLMLDKNGKIVFLDFGLISRVDLNIMDGFARGICHVLRGNWIGLVRVFREVGFTPPEGYFRIEREATKTDDKSTEESMVEISAEELAIAVKDSLERQEGGNSRFGALAVGLGELSSDYRFLTPPYIILLVRTFLTLEGIAGKVDPNFNIYSAALPYAAQRIVTTLVTKYVSRVKAKVLGLFGQVAGVAAGALRKLADMIDGAGKGKSNTNVAASVAT